jgi:alpha-mannosidase/mannosylglycerate hydrolase
VKSRRPPTTATPIRNVHYVLSTHWDREWYQPFQAFRHRLVRLFDRTLDDLAAGKLRGPFTTDGQAIVLDDYLEIRPERAAQVKQFVKSGKLQVGPWFVLPDEWLVSGEALVRNIELGRALTRQYGAEPSNAGFVCDLFGHISQLPQIFAGFGIHDALVWRGLEPRATAHLWWEAADGTRVLCYRFPRTAYCDYSWDIRRCHQREVTFDAARANRDLDAYLARESRRSPIPPLLLFDGGDHLEYDSDYYQALFARKPGAEFPYRILHSTLDAYLADVREHADQITDVIRGELRETGAHPLVEDQQWLIPGVLSSRAWIKQANVRCQMLLSHWAEPFGAVARAFTSLGYPAGFLHTAWRWLLMNHPHDSICGCSIDAVHEDMKYRFAQCEQIGENTTHDALLSLAAAVEGKIGDKEMRVLVANPLPRPLDETVELTLQIPAEWQCFNEFFGFEAKPGFRLYDPNGTEIPYQRVAQDMNRTKCRPLPRHFPAVYRTNDITVALTLSLPALGYTTLTVREGEMSAKDEIVVAGLLPTRYPATPGLATSERAMENAALAVTIETNGTLTLTDKRSGETYPRLLIFEDTADIGDGWYHGQAINDQAFVSTAAQADIALVADGPLLARFRIRTTLRVPAEFKFDRMVRSDAMTPLVIDNYVTLRLGADRLEVETVVQNQVRDHRLRVLFPTGAMTATYLADSAFDVVERPIALPKDSHLRRELAIETCPQQTWTAVADAARGLAVVAPGLMETAVRNLPDRPLALTLFRATRRTVFTDGEPNGQLPGELRFRYWLSPVRGEIDRVALSEAGIQLGAGLRNVQLPANGLLGLFAPVPQQLPPTASFLGITGRVVVTSMRERDGAVEVRCFNPDMRPVQATFTFHDRPRCAAQPQFAERVNFEGQSLGQRTAVSAGKFSTEVRSKEIVTVRFTTGSAA